MDNIKFTLTFKGEVSPYGDDPEAEHIAITRDELISQLSRLISFALSNGLVTGDSPATLTNHSFHISID